VFTYPFAMVLLVGERVMVALEIWLRFGDIVGSRFGASD
jgi:hypothetical protein